MIKWLAMASVLLCQAKDNKGADPDLLYKKDQGVSINKPPKNEEWEFKDKGFFTNSQLVVAHKVDDLKVDVFVQDSAKGFTYYDPKTAADGEWKNLSANPNFKDAKKIEIKNNKLPGGGAGNVQAQWLHMGFKLNDKPMELMMWCFVGRENQNFYKVTLVGEEGMYKKHQKMADYILSTVKIWKIPK